jgi:hypothetical protein
LGPRDRAFHPQKERPALENQTPGVMRSTRILAGARIDFHFLLSYSFLTFLSFLSFLESNWSLAHVDDEAIDVRLSTPVAHSSAPPRLDWRGQQYKYAS